MIKKKFTRTIITCVFAMVGLTASAQIGVGDIRGELEGAKDDVFGIINILMSMILFGGIIYVASALIGKREMSKGVIIGWVSAMILWGLTTSLMG